MKNTRQNNCDDVVELLVKKYWSESKSELDQKIAQIAQDFIGNKLFNSTRRVSKQVHTEFEYVQKLIEYIFESLKQDFSNITLTSCKDKLLGIVENEYKKLIPRTISRLVESNLGQKSMLENYEKGIIDEMEKAKTKIEIQCAISEKENVGVKSRGEKWYQSRTNQAAMITGICIIVGAILTSQWWLPFNDKIHDSIDPRTHRTKKAGQEVKAKQPIQIIPRTESGDLEKSIADLRVSKKLRKLTPLETDRSISQTPPGTYFFVHPIYITFVRDDFKNFLNRAKVDSYKSQRSSVEVQIDHEQQMFIIVYVSDEAAARLTEAKRDSLEEIVLSSVPWGNFKNLAVIPIKRIFESSYRSISIENEQTVGVLDILLE